MTSSTTGGRGLLLVILAPILAKLHLILGWRLADARFLESGIAANVLRRSLATLDPNIAYTSQALGHRAALDWLSGTIPWWNPYSGVGMPLAGDMQSAALFPPTLLLALPNGQLYMHISLQILAGLFTWLLLRRLGLAPMASAVAALLFEFNGTYAWLANAVVNPICFLPMILLGVETVRSRVQAGGRGGWSWIILGLALSLYAGFPEVAYFNGLLIAVWTLARLAGLAGRQRLAYLARVALGALGGLLVAAPILIAFLGYLPHANLGDHSDGGFRHVHLSAARLITLILPYGLGRLSDPGTAESFGFWGAVGGYTGIGLLTLGAIGAVGGHLRPLRLALAAWVAIVTGAIYGLPLVNAVVTAIPGVGWAMFFRYFAPSVAFALAILAGLGCQDVAGAAKPTRRQWLGITAVMAFAALALGLAAPLLALKPYRGPWLWGSLVVAVLVLGGMAAVLRRPTLDGHRRARWLGGLAVAEAVLLLLIPTVFYPRAGVLREDGIAFLQSHLGLQRFYTVGPVQPNYGAYYGIAGINHNDLPLPAAWVDHVIHRLDDNTQSIAFDGRDRRSAAGASAVENVRRDMDAYRDVGVRYVVSVPGQGPFDWRPSGMSDQEQRPLVLADGDAAILTLPADAGRAPFDAKRDQVAAVGLTVRSLKNGAADGRLTLRLCGGGTCAEGGRGLSDIVGGGYVLIPLSGTVPLAGDMPLTLEIRRVGGHKRFGLAMWTMAADTGRTLTLNGTPVGGMEPHLALALAAAAAAPADGGGPVFRDEVMQIDALTDPRPYFNADGCQLTPTTRERLTADCAAPSSLTRLELFMPGWTATVNGREQAVATDGPLFQKLALPAGQSEVVFRYSPPHMGWGYVALVAGLALTLLGAGPGRQRSLTDPR
ncbi:glycosyltransferase family protein [Nitrospirillum pindoramense]|nr:YfhO family protein [Nitrospirillum amazonense]